MKNTGLKIIFFDNHIIVAEKPRGIPTQDAPNSFTSLEQEVKEWMKKEFQKTGNIFLQVVHRIDQVVSGIVIFAKTSKALERLNSKMKEKEFQKEYIAEVEGIVKKDQEEVQHYLRHDDHKASIVNSQTKDAKLAILQYIVIERKDSSTILKIRLKTGRYHQIRAQMKAIGHPIVGDIKYGAKKINDPGILLHHYFVEFEHPITKEKKQFFSFPDFFDLNHKKDI